MWPALRSLTARALLAQGVSLCVLIGLAAVVALVEGRWPRPADLQPVLLPLAASLGLSAAGVAFRAEGGPLALGAAGHRPAWPILTLMCAGLPLAMAGGPPIASRSPVVRHLVEADQTVSIQLPTLDPPITLRFDAEGATRSDTGDRWADLDLRPRWGNADAAPASLVWALIRLLGLLLLSALVLNGPVRGLAAGLGLAGLIFALSHALAWPGAP